jgi:uncharacterized protein (TIGR02996 family)
MQMNEETFLSALHADCRDEVTWLALADWLEDNGQQGRAELVRLVRRLRALPVMKRTRRRAAVEERVAALLTAGERPVVPEVVNSLGMRLALIPPGRFRMGSPTTEKWRDSNEKTHEVEITRPFYLSVFPVTQRQWQALMGHNPSFFCAAGRGNDDVAGLDTSAFPVEQVSWKDAQAFLKQLSAQPAERKTGRQYRLPTEAEWEYACRGGACSSTAFHFGSTLSWTHANFGANYVGGEADVGPYLTRTCQVGLYSPNAFGLYDMHGNVREWCSDWYGEDFYAISPQRDPAGPAKGRARVLRGGCWYDFVEFCRSATRDAGSPGDGFFHIGFRVAAVPSRE